MDVILFLPETFYEPNSCGGKDTGCMWPSQEGPPLTKSDLVGATAEGQLGPQKLPIQPTYLMKGAYVSSPPTRKGQKFVLSRRQLCILSLGFIFPTPIHLPTPYHLWTFQMPHTLSWLPTRVASDQDLTVQ